VRLSRRISQLEQPVSVCCAALTSGARGRRGAAKLDVRRSKEASERVRASFGGSGQQTRRRDRAQRPCSPCSTTLKSGKCSCWNDIGSHTRGRRARAAGKSERGRRKMVFGSGVGGEGRGDAPPSSATPSHSSPRPSGSSPLEAIGPSPRCLTTAKRREGEKRIETSRGADPARNERWGWEAIKK
jgi:hypothetical protein